MLFQSRVCPQTGKVQSCDTRSGALVFEQPFIAFIVVFAHPSKCTQSTLLAYSSQAMFFTQRTRPVGSTR